MRTLWRRVLDHVGGVGVLWIPFLLFFTWLLWRAAWTRRGDQIEMTIIFWGVSYVTVRRYREQDRRREAAKRALAEVWLKIPYEQAERIRRGLS